MVELKRTDKKKGRVWLRRALNQQSFGNCESWNFIVGKKSDAESGVSPKKGKLHVHNSLLIHSLFTNLQITLGTTCG